MAGMKNWITKTFGTSDAPVCNTSRQALEEMVNIYMNGLEHMIPLYQESMQQKELNAVIAGRLQKAMLTARVPLSTELPERRPGLAFSVFANVQNNSRDFGVNLRMDFAKLLTGDGITYEDAMVLTEGFFNLTNTAMDSLNPVLQAYQEVIARTAALSADKDSIEYLKQLAALRKAQSRYAISSSNALVLLYWHR